MLNRQDRFFSSSGAIYPGGPSIWHVVDWDQRRLVSVKMDEEQESEDVAFEHLLKHIDTLAPNVYLVYLSPDGDGIFCPHQAIGRMMKPCACSGRHSTQRNFQTMLLSFRGQSSRRLRGLAQMSTWW